MNFLNHLRPSTHNDAMLRRVLALSLLCAFLTPRLARSTTVIPQTFDSLVTKAATIFVGEVIDVRSVWMATPQGRAIKTDVVFKVEDVWKGSVGAVTQLEFLGGTVGETTMEVVGMPVFRDGQRSVLFVTGERGASPLVGLFQGRMRIEKDPYGVDRVRTHDGRSLGNLAEIGARRLNGLISMTPMRLADVASAVRSRAGTGRPR